MQRHFAASECTSEARASAAEVVQSAHVLYIKYIMLVIWRLQELSHHMVT